MVTLTLSNDDIINCLDMSTASELLLEYDRSTFFEIIDKLSYNNLNGALLEKFDSDNNILSTDYISKKKASTIKIIDNNFIKVNLTTINKTESDILDIFNLLDDLVLAFGEML